MLLQCCSAVFAVLESSTSNHTNASSSIFQSSDILAALPSPARGPFAGGGGRRRRFFRRRGRGRGVVISGRLGSRDGGGGGGGDGGRGGLDVVGAVGGSGVGQECSLGDELADHGLGHGTSPSAGSQEDLLVEMSERVAELCPKFVRGQGIEYFENGCLVLKCAGMRGVLMKDGDRVDDEGEDVGDGLGGDERQWLVVGFRDGGELSIQEGGDGQVLRRDNSKCCNSLVFLLLSRQSVEKVAP